MKKTFTFKASVKLFSLIAAMLFAGTSHTQAQYCTITGQDCNSGDEITSFYTNGATVDISNKFSGCSPNGYGDFTNDTLKTEPGGSFTVNVLPGYYSGTSIWIDFNQDNDFQDPNEKVWDSGTYTMSLQTGTVNIPLSVTNYGPTRMRVITGFLCLPADPCNPCGYGYSETEDYTIDIASPPQHDMKVSQWVSPDSTVLSGNRPVTIEIINVGVQSQTPTISYTIDGGNNWITENVSQTMNSGDTLQHTFSSLANFSSSGYYDCIAAVHIPNDTVNPLNDTLSFKIGSFSGRSVPFMENFETSSYNDWFSNFYDNYVSVTYSWRLDSGRTQSRNTGPLSDHTKGGDYSGRYLTCKPSGVPAHFVSPYLDTTSFPAIPKLKFFYFLHGSGGNIYIQENTNGTWETIDSLVGPIQFSMKDPWRIKTVDLSSDAIQFRFIGTNTGGGNIAIDDIYIPAENDLIISSVNNPIPSIDMQNSSNVKIKITNIGTSPQSNFDVKFSLDGGNTYTTENVSNTINPDSSILYTFNTTADLTNYGTYDMQFVVDNSGDLNAANDTMSRQVVNYSMPYEQNFDNAMPYNLPYGWDYTLGIADGWVETRGSGSLSAPNSLNFWNGSAENGQALMAVLPPYYGSFSDKWIQIWIDSNSDQDSVFVGVMDNPNDSSSFVPTDTITFSQTSHYAPHYALLSNYSGTGNYVAIRHSASSSYSYMWMDDLIFETAPNGPRLSSDPDSLDMHQVLYNQNDTIYRTMKLYNDGPGVLQITSTSVSGTNTGNFTIMDNNAYPMNLNYGDSISLDVKFYGDTLGMKSVNLDVTANASVNSIKIYGWVVDAKIDTFPYVETFDHFGMPPIGWFARSNSNYQWYLNSGGTPNSFTGPDGDHQTGTGYYVYTEASAGNYQDEAMLITPEIDFSSIQKPRMNFWYHMYGYDIDTLSVDAAINGNWVKMIDTIIGQQQTTNSDPWLMYSVDLSAHANLDSIRFRSKRGFSSAGDVAVDDIAWGTEYINIGPDTTLCNGDTITIDASVGGSTTRTFIWYYNDMTNIISNNAVISTDSSGTYYIRFNDIGYFSGMDSISISTSTSPNIFITGPDTMNYYTDTIYLDAGTGYASYIWSTGDTSHAISIDSSDVNVGLNTISVTVMNNAGCSSTVDKDIYVNDDTGLKNKSQNTEISIYPNPNDGKFIINIPEITSGELKIISSQGKLIYSESIQQQRTRKLLNLNGISAGVYYIKLIHEQGVVTKNLIIE